MRPVRGSATAETYLMQLWTAAWLPTSIDPVPAATLTDDNAVSDVVAIMTSKITSIYRIEWCSNLRYAFAAGGRHVSWGTSHAASTCISCQHDALQSTAFSSTFTPRSEGSDFQIRCTKFGSIAITARFTPRQFLKAADLLQRSCMFISGTNLIFVLGIDHLNSQVF